MRAPPVTIAATLLALAGLTSRARAGGYELLPGGTQSVSRGGAVAARPENGMTLLQNPAGMALLTDGQFTLNFDLAAYSMCVDSYGYYGWGVYQSQLTQFGRKDKDQLGDEYGRTPLPKVCNSAPIGPQPQIIWVGKIGENLALAGGLVFPTAVPGVQYGGADGTVQTPQGSRPTPTRYELIRQTPKGGYIATVGAAYKIAPALQVGVTFQALGVRATARAVQNIESTAAPYTDWLVDVDAHDYFIPTAVFGLNSKPIPELDLMAAFHWSDKFRGSGSVQYETATFEHGMTSGPIPTRNARVKLSTIELGFPWELTAAVRYGALLPESKPTPDSKAKHLGDPLDKERWDIEVDYTYTLNSAAGSSKVAAGEDATVVTRTAGGAGDMMVVTPGQVGNVDVQHHFYNSSAVRLGGSFSVIPRALALEAGGFYESRGVDPAYVTIDNFAFARVGFGLGLMARVGDFDLLAGYSHIFQETIEVAPPPNNDDPRHGFSQRIGVTMHPNGTVDPGPVVKDPSAPSPATADAVAAARAAQPSADASSRVRDPQIINAGKYTASFDIFSIGMVYHY